MLRATFQYEMRTRLCKLSNMVPAFIEAVLHGAWLQTMGPGGHKRLQEAPSSKFLVHNSSLDRQVEMAKAANAKEAQNELFHGPQSSTDFNIVASS